MDCFVSRIDIICDPYLEGPKLKPYPKKLGPYKKRTMKRWAKDSKHWTPPPMYRIGNAIHCHPSMVRHLQQVITSQGSRYRLL